MVMIQTNMFQSQTNITAIFLEHFQKLLIFYYFFLFLHDLLLLICSAPLNGASLSPTYD